MSLSELVQKRMFLLTLFLFVLFGFFGGNQNIEINKTIGWAWDLTGWSFFLKAYFLPSFLMGYGILAILKYTTNEALSFTHLSIILLIFIFDQTASISIVMFDTLYLISCITFLYNFIWSIRNREKY
ncbi:hypothetical protein ACU8DI_11115 [Psychroserpens sp. BH13MA-6]